MIAYRYESMYSTEALASIRLLQFHIKTHNRPLKVTGSQRAVCGGCSVSIYQGKDPDCHGGVDAYVPDCNLAPVKVL